MNYTPDEISHIQLELMYGGRTDYLHLFTETLLNRIEQSNNEVKCNCEQLETLIQKQITAMQEDNISDLTVGYVCDRYQGLKYSMGC